ncbi:hypothetical protein E4T56_gene20533 [Termitomyces sp. T112]|nr:hypothetical protein E4T56_gene20533 [Termitomyces sp. T112]
MTGLEHWITVWAEKTRASTIPGVKVMSAVVQVLSAFSVVYACSDGNYDYSHHSSLPSTVNPPSHPLEWGDINIIHTTDSHGWLLGHQKLSSPEPNYSADLGEFASFVTHMKELALKKDVDLLLVDSGDLHDGTGLTDGDPAGGVNGQEAIPFFTKLPYDLLAIGNHELYNYSVTLDVYRNFAPKFKGRYLTSNVNITLPGSNTSVPIGNRYAKFRTRKGRKVTSLGVLFDFTASINGTSVQKVADMINETWFFEAIKEEPDLFLLAGHMPVGKEDSLDKWPLVFNAIRTLHPYTPILILGGHTHIRDCAQYDGRSMALESGRYMETIGWLSAKLDGKTKKSQDPKDIVFSRRYLDPNRVTYKYHTGIKDSKFDTTLGMFISRSLKVLAEKFGLNFVYGTAPHDYTIYQSPYPSEGSLLSLFSEKVLPYALSVNNTRSKVPNLIIVSASSQRFDIYAGSFTKNDQLTASFYPDRFLYIPEVRLSDAKKVVSALNGLSNPPARRQSSRQMQGSKEDDLQYVGEKYHAWFWDMNGHNDVERYVTTRSQTLGYVTKDSCPGIGDDTLHAPLAYYTFPKFVHSDVPDVPENAPIDLVFINYIEASVLTFLNKVQTVKVYDSSDIRLYSQVLANEALGIYAQALWN